MKASAQTHRAFTLVDLLVVISTLTLLVAIQLPVFAGTKAKVQVISCSDNLKRIGVAFRTWAENHAGRTPMTTPRTEGGASSAIGFRATGITYAFNMPASGPLGVFGMFAVMSNELTTPKILYCPSEYRSTVTQGSIFGNTASNTFGCYSDNQISYFVGVDANDARPSMFLSGDSNIGDGATPPTTGNTYSSPSSIRKFIVLGTNASWTASSPNWADNQHRKQGNVLLSDGSVQTFSTAELRDALNKTGDSDRAVNNGFVKANGVASTSMNRLQFP